MKRRISVKHLWTPRFREAKDQHEITTTYGTVFQSYESTIAVRTADGRVFLDQVYWNYSTTTRRYLYQFLDCVGSECRERVNSGVYLLADLSAHDWEFLGEDHG